MAKFHKKPHTQHFPEHFHSSLVESSGGGRVKRNSSMAKKFFR